MPIPAIVATLLANGLGILGNAVLTKGQAVVEEKLGIKLEPLVDNSEGLLQLKQAEIDHEEFLVNAALEEAEMYIEDVQDAREMFTKISESEHASWLAKNIVPILALIVVIGGGAVITWSPHTDVRMAAVGIVTLVLGYFFGTTKNSGTKDTTIADLARSSK